MKNKSKGSDASVWDRIFKKEGRLFTEPFPRFNDLVATYKKYGCTNLLDLGCGSGRHVVHLTKAGFNVCGMDNSPTALGMAQEWLKEEEQSASLILADIGDHFPIKDEVFNGLLSTQVIHHQFRPKVYQTISEIKRVTADGCVIFITVPAGKDPEDECVEIEPNTYVPTVGWEKGVPHYLFKLEELGEAFNEYEIMELSLRGERINALLAVKR